MNISDWKEKLKLNYNRMVIWEPCITRFIIPHTQTFAVHNVVNTQAEQRAFVGGSYSWATFFKTVC